LTTYITLLKKKLKLVDKIYSVHTLIEHDEQPEHLLFLVCAQNLRKERGNGGVSEPLRDFNTNMYHAKRKNWTRQY
jgi:hypothetical protein